MPTTTGHPVYEAVRVYRGVARSLRHRAPRRHNPSTRKDRLMAASISVDLTGITWGELRKVVELAESVGLTAPLDVIVK